MTNRVVAVLVLLALRVPAPALGQDAPPGAIRFESRMLSLGTSGGEFRRWHVMRAHIDEAHPERSEVDVEVDLKSLDTGIGERDRHLCGESFFDVEHFPIAVAKLRNVRLDDTGRFTVDVTLELHGRSATFPMTFSIEDRAARRIRGEVTLRRLDFDIGPQLGWRNTMGIQNDVQVTVEAVVPAGS